MAKCIIYNSVNRTLFKLSTCIILYLLYTYEFLYGNGCINNLKIHITVIFDFSTTVKYKKGNGYILQETKNKLRSHD